MEHNYRPTNPKETILKFAEATKAFGHCDKCNQVVSPENNAVIFDYIMSGATNWTHYFAVNRHLEPVTDAHGVVICEGSPSRFQNISGIPDSRAEYRSTRGQDSIALKVWNWMQEELGQKTIENKVEPQK